MAFTTTREGRAVRWRSLRVLAAATVALSVFHITATANAQVVKAPSKNQLRTPAKAPTNDNEADKLNAKWLSENNQGVESTKPAATTGPSDDERFSSIPSMAPSAGTGARALVSGSVKLVKASSTEAAFSSVPGGTNFPAFKDMSQAFTGFGGSAPNIEVVQGRTGDGWTRLLYASIGDSKNQRSYWWFSPPDQPEGWFDDNGRRLGGTALADPKPDSRISSPFGTRRYYGRSTGTGFHNGIDFEGKTGEPIYASADGVINHQGWYFNYGRTVKISHADNFETLYAHMSRFAPGLAAGSQVRRGDVIGFIGSTGRSTGPHLHFSAIVNGQFVDPAPFLSAQGNSQLTPNALVSFRQWQQEIRKSVEPAKKAGSGRSNLQGHDGWTQNPFAQRAGDQRL